MEYIGVLFQNKREAVVYGIVEYVTAACWNTLHEALDALEQPGEDLIDAASADGWAWPDGCDDEFVIECIPEAIAVIENMIEDGEEDCY